MKTLFPHHVAVSLPEPEAASESWADRLVYGFMRHWLALILTAMLIFVSVPFLAPVAMHLGWSGVGNLIYFLYSPFCHQLPQRSWFLFGDKLTYTLGEIAQVYPHLEAWQLRRFTGEPGMGWKVAWSDRMISFYFLTPVFGLVYGLVRTVGWRVRPIPFKLLLLLLLPMTLDGVTHLVNDLVFGVTGNGFRDTNAWLALLTGHAFPGFYAGDHFGTFNWWMRLLTGMVAAWGLAFWVFPWIDRLMADEVDRYAKRLLSLRDSVGEQESQD